MGANKTNKITVWNVYKTATDVHDGNHHVNVGNHLVKIANLYIILFFFFFFLNVSTLGNSFIILVLSLLWIRFILL